MNFIFPSKQIFSFGAVGSVVPHPKTTSAIATINILIVNYFTFLKKLLMKNTRVDSNSEQGKMTSDA